MLMFAPQGLSRSLKWFQKCELTVFQLFPIYLNVSWSCHIDIKLWWLSLLVSFPFPRNICTLSRLTIPVLLHSIILLIFHLLLLHLDFHYSFVPSHCRQSLNVKNQTRSVTKFHYRSFHACQSRTSSTQLEIKNLTTLYKIYYSMILGIHSIFEKNEKMDR